MISSPHLTSHHINTPIVHYISSHLNIQFIHVFPDNNVYVHTTCVCTFTGHSSASAVRSVRVTSQHPMIGGVTPKKNTSLSISTVKIE